MTDHPITYDVVVYTPRELTDRPRRKPHQARWKVGKKRWSKTFATLKQAERHTNMLKLAADEGKPFDVEYGLPVALAREQRELEAASQSPVTWLDHAEAFAVHKWPELAGNSRRSIAEVLQDITIILLPDEPGRPNDAAMKRALRRHLFAPAPSREPPTAMETECLEWAKGHSLPLEALSNFVTLRRLLDGLTRTRRGTASPNYFTRRRSVLHNVLDYAVSTENLNVNPLAQPGLRWKPPVGVKRGGDDDTIDPRIVGTDADVERILAEVPDRYVAFYAVMYYAMLRPEEAVDLRKVDCFLPADGGWGRLIVSGATPAPGRLWTDSGSTHESRGLKHRSNKATRSIPAPPRLVELLRSHLDKYGARGGFLFRNTRGRRIDSSTCSRVWEKARQAALTEDELITDLLGHTYALRHSGVSMWRNAGVPAPQVAEWAGHSARVLDSVYSKVLTGLEDRWKQHLDTFLGTPVEHSGGEKADQQVNGGVGTGL